MEGALVHVSVVVVIDDGSTDATARAAEDAGAVVLRNPANQGKGKAFQQGIAHALSIHADVILTLDGDGQHDPSDLKRFLETHVQTGIPVLIGNRLWRSGGMPLRRRVVNVAMSRLLGSIGGIYLPDSQNGFRLYRADVLRNLVLTSGHFATESEILLRLSQRGVRMDSVRIDPVYTRGGSHIRPLRDAVRFFRMLSAIRS